MCLTLHRPIMIMSNLLILTISLGDIKDKMSKFSNKCKILHTQVKNYLLISDERCCKVINKFKFKVSYNSLKHEWLWHTVYGPNCSSPPTFLNNLHIILGLRPLNTNLNLNMTDHYIIIVLLNFKNSRLCLNHESNYELWIKKIIWWLWRKTFKIFCICEGNFLQNWTRNDFCIIFVVEKKWVLHEI